MRFSINIGNLTSTVGPEAIGPSLPEVARAVDEAGLDTPWVGDHLIQSNPYDTTGDDMLEAYPVLGFPGGPDRAGPPCVMVTAVTLRPPSLLIKAVTSLDVLSGGRAWLGIGASYNKAEARAMDLCRCLQPVRYSRADGPPKTQTRCARRALPGRGPSRP